MRCGQQGEREDAVSYIGTPALQHSAAKTRARRRKKGEVHGDEAGWDEKSDGPFAGNKRQRSPVHEPAEYDHATLDRRIGRRARVEEEAHSGSAWPCRLESGDKIRRPMRRI